MAEEQQILTGMEEFMRDLTDEESFEQRDVAVFERLKTYQSNYEKEIALAVLDIASGEGDAVLKDLYREHKVSTKLIDEFIKKHEQ